MKDSEYRNLIKQSELATSTGFTDRVMSEIEAKPVLKPSPVLWSKKKIFIAFASVAVLSGVYLQFYWFGAFVSNYGAIPFFWSLFLLLGLNHVLTMRACQNKLNAKSSPVK